MEDGTIKYEALSNHEVCQVLQTMSFTTLLRTRRLKFLQSMVAQPQLHELYLACLCGQYEMDIQTQQEMEAFNHADLGGRTPLATQQDMEAHNQADLRKQAARPACNKWQAQFYEDLQQLRHFDATYWIVDEISPNLHELVKNEDVRHAFINFDIKEVGQREITMKINVHEISKAYALCRRPL